MPPGTVSGSPLTIAKRAAYRSRRRLAASPLAALAARAERAAFDRRPRTGRFARRHVVVLGDSHARVLARWWPRAWWFDVTSVEGATVTGIRRTDSETAALPRFKARLATRKPWQPVAVLLGEVDCGYVIWRRAEHRGLPVDASMRDSLERYLAFLREDVAPGVPELLVISVPLPTLPDDVDAWHGWVAQRRSDVRVSQAARTALTERFNAKLRAACEREGWTFVDATSAQRDPATGLVREGLRRRSGDHHLRDRPYRQLIRAALPPA